MAGQKERFFVYHESEISECSAESVAYEAGELICHDYWLIAPAIYANSKNLPKKIIDVEELRITTSGRREDRENRDRKDVFNVLTTFLDVETIGQYRNMTLKNARFDVEVFKRVGEALLHAYEKIVCDAKLADEWDRYEKIEMPVAGYLIRAVAEGIALDRVALKKHKAEIDFSYYMALKDFSARYSLPLRVPSDDDVIKYLEPRGFDFSGVGVEYVLNFVPTSDGFSENLIELRRIAKSRDTLKAIPLSQKRIFPIVDAFGSITSRIYFKDPSLQNLSKRHRDIICADKGMNLSYVDFGQYEAGIMGALSGDEVMLGLFSSGDLYSQVAENIFSDSTKRKQAKRLFLSYAYGMRRKGLIDAAVQYGARRDAAKAFFNQFSKFESWKLTIYEEFFDKGRIGTAFGNYLSRDAECELSDKEKRSAVSQVIQGTASLIFKKALLQLAAIKEVEIKVPMHDAVLFQHSSSFEPESVSSLFAKVLTDHFDGLIQGKASIEKFFVEE